MKFLVYTADPFDKNAPLSVFDEDIDEGLGRIMDILRQMNLERVLDNQSISLLVDEITYDSETDSIYADIYKDTNQGSALHQFNREGGEVTIQEVLSEDEEAFEKGRLGVRKIDGTIYFVVKKNFGSYFAAASLGMDLHPRYSSEAIKSIQQSEYIEDTSFDFSEDYDLTASLARPPQDGDVRKDEGFGMADPINKVMSLMRISRAHRITIDIGRDEWLENVETFEGIIQSDIVSAIKVTTSNQGIVTLGEGGDRAIRETIEVDSAGTVAIRDALDKLEENEEEEE